MGSTIIRYIQVLLQKQRDIPPQDNVYNAFEEPLDPFFIPSYAWLQNVRPLGVRYERYSSNDLGFVLLASLVILLPTFFG